MHFFSFAAALLACTGGADDSGSPVAQPEPLTLPEDPAARGVPVGNRTIEADGVTLEVFYPASDSVAAQATTPISLDEFLPASVTEVLGPVDLPELDPGSVRDAPLRVPVAPYPVVLFSHGFGGFRVQSVDYATHLASRGYVVVAMDHPGRMLGDVLPCVFSPPLEGCNLSFTPDPAEDDIPKGLAWVQAAAAEGDFAGALDLGRIALSGHSAGAGSTATVGNAEEAFVALLPMAAPVTITREVPSLIMGGSCDFVADGDALQASLAGSVEGTGLVVLEGAGHLAFSDLCTLELGAFAETLLAPRDDINSAILGQLLQLATDGCPGATPAVKRPECAAGFQDLDQGQEIVRAYATVFFDARLYDSGQDAVPQGLVDGATAY